MTATAPLTLDLVLEAARKLPIDDQYQLCNQLEIELCGPAGDSDDWENELNRRVAEVESGVAEVIPAATVMAELQAMLQRGQ
jgi:hypothetical protein